MLMAVGPVVLALAAASGVAGAGQPLWVVVAALGAVTVVGVVAALVPPVHSQAVCLMLGAEALALSLAVASRSDLVLAVLASLLAVLAVAVTALRREAAPAVVLLVALTVDGWAHVADADILTRSDLQTAVACLFLLGTSYVIRVGVARVLTESAAGVVAVAALALASDTAVHLAAILTVVGTAIALLAVLRHDRVHLGWVGSAVLTAGTLVRLDLPTSIGAEVYTLPAAALLIAAGVHRLLREPTTGTWTVLGSGLTLALVPSMLISLPEPNSLRAFLVGTGAAVALVVGMERRWQAPFLVGAAVLGVLALRFLLPLAQEVLANPLGALDAVRLARRRLPGGRHPVGAVAAEPAARLAVRRGPALRSLAGSRRSTPPGASSARPGEWPGGHLLRRDRRATRSRDRRRASTRGSPTDEVLRPMYPEEDLGPAAERLHAVPGAVLGRPHDYSDRRGHPRLRMRHAPFEVTPTAAPLAQPLPRGPRRGGPHSGAGRPVLGLRHPRRPVHGEHASRSDLAEPSPAEQPLALVAGSSRCARWVSLSKPTSTDPAAGQHRRRRRGSRRRQHHNDLPPDVGDPRCTSYGSSRNRIGRR